MSERRIRVVALVLHQGRVLLVSTKRAASDRLVPPGGGLEHGEQAPDAAAREVAEEAGVRVVVGDLIGYREATHGGIEEVELYFSARLAPASESACASSSEGRQVRWVPLADLPSIPHYPESLADLCQRLATDSVGAIVLPPVSY